MLRLAMDDRTKGRLRLWLRSERAHGLSAVGVGQVSTADLDESPAGQPADVDSQNSVDLFVKDNPAPAAALRPSIVVPMADAPALSREQKIAALAALDESQVRSCTLCRLCEQRTQTVFGEGDPEARLFFIGEGPGETEDRTGRPFVGRAGELLTKMIAGMGLARQQVYIANIVKCRPPGNRVPSPDEIASCTPYLERQLEIIRPQVIVTLGLPATRHMLQVTSSMGRLRGNWHEWRGIKLMPTFHPSYILRVDSRETKALVWSDLKQVMVELGLPIPQRNAEGKSPTP